MKPLRLIMSAFGSYADVQEIDFKKLGTGLYLITGETGAGKTTIFDAISFALFGKASGTARDNYYMLRSDFAKETTKTFVEFDFASGESHYNIKRIIKNDGQDVFLVLSDGRLISGVNNVKEKITEIIGLDSKQFAQIIMIAQNDFLRFLQSNNTERKEILRRIFNTEPLELFQKHLKTLVKQEENNREILIGYFKRYEVDIYKRDEIFKEWDIKIKNDKLQLNNINQKLDIYDKQKQELAAELAISEELNKKFTELLNLRKLLDKYKSIENIKIRASNGEIALYKIKPIYNEMQKAVKNYADIQADLLYAQKKKVNADLELEKANIYIESLPILEDVQADYNDLLKKWELESQKLKQLSLLKKDFDIIVDKNNELKKEQLKFEELNAEFLELEKRYIICEEVFLRSQAGIIASSLKNGEPCPVCGSTLHPSPAVLSDKSISEVSLKKAKEAKDKLNAKREQQSNICNTIQSEKSTLSKRFKNDILEFMPEFSKGEFKELILKTQSQVKDLDIKKENDKNGLDILINNWDLAIKQKTNAIADAQSAETLLNERIINEKKLFILKNEAELKYKTADTIDYKTAIITEDELDILKKQISDYEHIIRDISRLEKETYDKQPPDISNLQNKAANYNYTSKALHEQRDEINGHLNKTKTALEELRNIAVQFEKSEKTHATIKQLSETANGKLDFETYVQISYFEYVLNAANIRLKIMSQNRYTLLREEEADNKSKNFGLGTEVLDTYTGKPRPTNSLSGGESFIVSLSLALGLSDVVCQNAGGIRLDAMFIDEGFGSLDSDTLDLAIKTLSEMAGDRVIGIISHVVELRERINSQIRVEKTLQGSRVFM